MNKFDFVFGMTNSFTSEKEQQKKRVYVNQLNGFVLACPEEFLQDVFNHAHSMEGYPDVKELLRYATEQGFFGDEKELIEWVCDHGRVGIPSDVIGNYCIKCGDKRK